MTKMTFDFTGVDALANNDGYAPPQGAYKATITEATIEASKNIQGASNLVVSYNVIEGEHTGSGCRAWFPLPTGTDGKKDAFKLRKLKTLFLAIGAPANALQGQFGIELSQIQGKMLVIFVSDRDADAATGRRRYDAEPVLPENATSALSGEWTPYGGRAMKTTPANGSSGIAPNAMAEAQDAFNFGGFQTNVP